MEGILDFHYSDIRKDLVVPWRNPEALSQMTLCRDCSHMQSTQMTDPGSTPLLRRYLPRFCAKFRNLLSEPCESIEIPLKIISASRGVRETSGLNYVSLRAANLSGQPKFSPKYTNSFFLTDKIKQMKGVLCLKLMIKMANPKCICSSCVAQVNV